MILKVERYADGEGWWIVDGVKRIATSIRMKYETEEDRKEVMTGPPDVAFLDLIKCNCSGEMVGCTFCVDHRHYRICRLSCRMEDGSDYLVVFDTIVYVLNDNGKTIEKIVANYKE
jgi:hypothetical protein